MQHSLKQNEVKYQWEVHNLLEKTYPITERQKYQGKHRVNNNAREITMADLNHNFLLVTLHFKFLVLD